MIAEASITGLIRTLLIIVGVIVLLRFLGQVMNAKRNMEHERKLNEQDRKYRAERASKMKNLGKTKVIRGSRSQNVEDVDYEEVD